MWTPEYYIKLLPFDMDVGGAVVANEDGSFEIYLNSRMSEAQQRRWLSHELEHISADHFSRGANGESVAVIEAEASGRGRAG